MTGMTLIEVLVAMAIVGILGTMLWTAFAQTDRNRRVIEAAQDRYHQASVAMSHIARDLQSAFLSNHFNPARPVWRTAFVGQDRPPFDRVDFTSFSHRRVLRDSHESDQAEIGYFTAPDGRLRDQTNLVRRESRRIDDDVQHVGSVLVLIQDVTAFDVHYYDTQSSQWLEYWDTTQPATGQPNRLPLFIKVALGLHDERGRDIRLVQKIDLMMTSALVF